MTSGGFLLAMLVGSRAEFAIGYPEANGRDLEETETSTSSISRSAIHRQRLCRAVEALARDTRDTAALTRAVCSSAAAHSRARDKHIPRISKHKEDD